jgi:histidinol-phosphate aminotransferase
VPLTADFRHDLPRMQAAAAHGGLIYVCNPNNPTATITPKQDVRAFLATVPTSTPVLVDEAYFHFVDEPQYETVIPLVADFPNLIVTRTFSKIHGMAGLRCGYAVAQTATIAKLRVHQAFDSVGILPLVAALASLRDADHLLRCHRLNREVKTTTCAELDRLGYRYLPSAANFLMIDVRQPVGPLIAAFQQHNIEVGRAFPALPHHLRVTLGTADQMTAFLGAFRAILPAAKAA